MAKTRHSNPAQSTPPPIKKKAKEKSSAPQEPNKAQEKVAEIQHICRTCLEEIQASSLIPLNDFSSNIRNELRVCIPEVDCDLIPNAVICTNCYNSLNNAYEFKQMCLQTEQKLRQQIHKKYTIDLNKLKKNDCVHVPSNNDSCVDAVYINETLQIDMEASLPSVDNNKTSDAIYNCKHCDYKCDACQPFVLHIKSHRKLNNYLCPLCDFQSRFMGVFVHHLNCESRRKNILLRQNVVVRDNCPINNGEQIQVSTEATSAISNCLEEERVFVADASIPSVDNDKTSDAIYNCKHCEYKCDAFQLFVSHIKTHTNLNNYICPLCDFQSKYMRGFVRHLKCDSRQKKIPLEPEVVVPDNHAINVNEQMEVPTEASSAISNCLDEEIDQITPFVIQKPKLVIDLSKSRIPESVISEMLKETTENQDSESSDSLDFFCSYCNITCEGMKSYRLHVNTHDSSRYICPCNFGTRRWENFIMHVKRSCILYKDISTSSMDSNKRSSCAEADDSNKENGSNNVNSVNIDEKED